MSTRLKTLEAILHQWAFKPEPMRRMLVAVLQLALRGGGGGEFSALDLPTHGEVAHGGSGIAGSVFLQLKHDGILEAVGVWVDGTFYPRTVINGGGNKISVYRLAKPELARTLLGRHAPSLVSRPVQMELVSTPAPTGAAA
jgi:hypothetical protein